MHGVGLDTGAVEQGDWVGDACLRCGEIMALKWRDGDLHKRQVCIQQSDCKGRDSVGERYVPMTVRLTTTLRDQRHP